jgi:hypothetical protein
MKFLTTAFRGAPGATLILILQGVAWSLPAQAAGDIRSERVEFARGATSAVVEGRIQGYETVDYLLGAAKGQYMNVSMSTGNGAAYFNILAPGETEVAFFNGSTSGDRYAGALPASGDYRIRVYLMRSTARRDEVASYRLEMSVTGSPQRSSGHGAASGDALVAGTGFHATAQIPCVAEPGKPMSQCDAGVKRTAGGGTVQVTTPDGGSRVITFRDGKVVSTDADATFRVERRGDRTIVRIGTVEVYEIPDALVLGG